LDFPNKSRSTIQLESQFDSGVMTGLWNGRSL
jgi:hypothetical protein